MSILDSLKTLSHYGKIVLSISYLDNKWKINIDKSLDEDESFDLLKSFMHENLISDYYGKIIGQDNFACSSYSSDNGKVSLIKGEVFSDCIELEEKIFQSEIDFFLHVFSSYRDALFDHTKLLKISLKTPLQIFIDHIESKGIKLTGFQGGVYMDEDGYSYSQMYLQLSDGIEVRVDFPKKDTFIKGYLNISELNDEFFDFDTDFLELLKYITKDKVMDFINKYREE